MKQKILQAKDEELSKLAGEVLYDNPQHQWTRDRQCKGFASRYCSRCNLVWFSTSSETCDIKLTGPEAMKWRDWAVKEFGVRTFNFALRDVYYETEFEEYEEWLSGYAQPEHYIQAACLCKLEAEGNG